MGKTLQVGFGGVEVVVVVSRAHAKGEAGPTYKTEWWSSVLVDSMQGASF